MRTLEKLAYIVTSGRQCKGDYDSATIMAEFAHAWIESTGT